MFSLIRQTHHRQVRCFLEATNKEYVCIYFFTFTDPHMLKHILEWGRWGLTKALHGLLSSSP